MNTIESLMREMEEDRRQRRIATLSDTTQVDGGVWKVEPSPNACPTCLEFSRKTYAEKPNPTHPNCKCRISKQEKKTHINQEKEDSPISSLSTGTFLILKATILAFSAMITSGLMEKGTFHCILMVM